MPQFIVPAFPWTLQVVTEAELTALQSARPVLYDLDTTAEIYWATKQLTIRGFISVSQPAASAVLRINGTGPERASAPIRLIEPTDATVSGTNPPGGDFAATASFSFLSAGGGAAAVNDYAQQRLTLIVSGQVFGPSGFLPVGFSSNDDGEDFSAVGVCRFEGQEIRLRSLLPANASLNVSLDVERIPFAN